jgi:hypothetical protein
MLHASLTRLDRPAVQKWFPTGVTGVFVFPAVPNLKVCRILSAGVIS